MIGTVIFDLDDTLYDEIEYCRSGFAAVAKFIAGRDGTPTAGLLFATLWDHFKTGDRSKVFNAALDDLGIGYDKERIAELVGIYRNHVPAIALPPDSEEVLRKLRAKYALGLLTDGFLPAQQLKVRALGIEAYFASIIYTEQLGRECWKPSPAGFEKILRDLGGRPENAVYVADNEQKDFIAPNRLGFVTVQLLRPARVHTSACAEPGAAARHVISQISELPALVESL
ncbi:MAG TPA: HAD family hydrolase [Sedimentisphaerales bacterium]|nr:HAD family hydrolase [Sedimentisphaerales bacterium]